MTLYVPAAVERAMKIQEVILRAMSGEIKCRDGRHSHRNSASGYALSPVMAIQTHIER